MSSCDAVVNEERDLKIQQRTPLFILLSQLACKFYPSLVYHQKLRLQ